VSGGVNERWQFLCLYNVRDIKKPQRLLRFFFAFVGMFCHFAFVGIVEKVRSPLFAVVVYVGRA